MLIKFNFNKLVNAKNKEFPTLKCKFGRKHIIKGRNYRTKLCVLRIMASLLVPDENYSHSVKQANHQEQHHQSDGWWGLTSLALSSSSFIPLLESLLYSTVPSWVWRSPFLPSRHYKRVDYCYNRAIISIIKTPL